MSLASQPPCVRSRLPVVVLVVALAAAFAVPAVGFVAGQPSVDEPGPGATASTGAGATTLADGPDAVPSAEGAHGTVIEGTVTDENGDPVEAAYVIVQANGERMLQNATDGEDSVRQSLLELVDEHPFGLYWNATTEEGRYSVHVPRPADYEVIAVSEDGISRLRHVSVRVQGAEQNLTVEPDRVLSVEADAQAVAPGEVTAVELRVPNPGDEPVEGLTLGLSTSEGWTVEGVETDGEYDPEAGAVTFDRIEPGEVATATVRVRAPEDAETDVLGLNVTADAKTHFVEHGGRVGATSGDGATATPTETEERFTFDSPEEPPDTRPTGLYLLSASVFAVGVAFAGYSVWRTGPPRLR